jgi:DNA-directed RNA polymerase specialized sigma24 family protein
MTDDPFTAHRSLLFTVAYEMLGSAADADDAVQETWLRWAGVDRSTVRDPRAYLVRMVTRQALNRLRTVSRRREDYVGEWLPEPLLTSPDVADDVELAESVSIAMLTVLETLGRPSARSSCCTRCSTSPTTRWRRPWASRGPRCGRSRTGRASTSPRAVPG